MTFLIQGYCNAGRKFLSLQGRNIFHPSICSRSALSSIVAQNVLRVTQELPHNAMPSNVKYQILSRPRPLRYKFSLLSWREKTLCLDPTVDYIWPGGRNILKGENWFVAQIIRGRESSKTFSLFVQKPFLKTRRGLYEVGGGVGGVGGWAEGWRVGWGEGGL